MIQRLQTARQIPTHAGQWRERKRHAALDVCAAAFDVEPRNEGFIMKLHDGENVSILDLKTRLLNILTVLNMWHFVHIF